MSKQEIENHEGWKYIVSLNNAERYSALFGEMQNRIEKTYDVKIEKWAFTQLPNIPNDALSLSVTDTILNTSFLAVLLPR